MCLGEATKFSHSLLDADKGYDASIRLGISPVRRAMRKARSSRGERRDCTDATLREVLAIVCRTDRADAAHV